MNERGTSFVNSARPQPSLPCDIAVVGMAVRLPGGLDDIDSLWSFLLDRGCAIREIPPDRWNKAAFHDPNPNIIGKGRSWWGGFLDDPFAFDPGFFDISPREALGMDPQQRLLLEVVYEAMQDAKLPPILVQFSASNPVLVTYLAAPDRRFR
jgi:acyl transferase domain-containing protein